MNWRGMRALMRKDLQQILDNKMVWLPMIVVPLLILILLPVVVVLGPTMMGDDMGRQLKDLDRFLAAFPQPLRDELLSYSPNELWVVLSANYIFAPLFLIVPLMTSSILGADSFAGEKERKTLEGLLYTPLADGELFGAKVLTALVPALAINIGSFVLFAIVVNLAGYPVMGRIFFPRPMWWALIFWLAPAVSVVGIGATVLISSRAKTFMQAQQMSGVLVVPIVALLLGQLAGVLVIDTRLLLLLGFLVWILGLGLLRMGAKTFARGELIARI